MSNSRLYFAATVACMTSALFGYSTGFIGGVLVLPSFKRHFDLFGLPPSETASIQARLVLGWLVGAFFGVPLGIPVCQRLGRRMCLNMSALLYVIGAIMQIVNLHLPTEKALALFEVGRFINGLGVGAGTLVSPMYISEISPADQRGMLMSGYQTVLQGCALVGFWGTFLTNSVLPDSNNLQWQVPVMVQLVPGALLLLGTLFIPESPRFHADKGDWEAVEISLSWLRGVPTGDEKLNEEIEKIQASVEAIQHAQAKQRSSFVREITKKGIRNRLGVGIGLMIVQNMAGMNAINYYAPIIFQSAGFKSVSSSLFLTGVFGIIKLFSALAFMFVFVKIRGNRFWLQLGSGICGLSMFILAYCVYSLPPPDASLEGKTTGLGVIAVLMTYIYTVFFCLSLGPISWNVCGEIFPIHINAKCVAITICTQWLFQCVVATLTPFLIALSGWVTYIVYGSFCAFTLVWVYACVPETRGVGLGKPMDKIFGITDDKDGIIDEQAPLLRNTSA